MSNAVTLYTTRFCPYCIRARFLLDSKNVEYTDIGVDANPELRREMMEKSGRRTVPQIWIGDRHVGGYDDLALLERQGKLDELLQLVS
ncbi:glutaredoxin 3 [Halioglobus japonicus]|uniref:Glutaredoxin n=1 Tax=Halioglobus japonicus TaxID=930805 RepID=A0AAP8SMB4_9GAMM|nr:MULTISPECIES: glutaredoxin 3 [Halioglobus]KZX56050.1 glutaredoxin [Halioglobus sp. HI00S01]PLW85395.1 glutaredoxin 3 [Halioglobus japonicus]GHD15449.1 glutaredoxin 3 [Halioglobus japonicus]